MFRLLKIFILKEMIVIQYYEKVMKALSDYFIMDHWRQLFVQGGCYWFANLLYQGIADSIIMINRGEEHCAIYFENGLYDVRGRISQKNFKIAGDREISFMKKNYIPGFDTEKLENYLTMKGLINKDKVCK